MIFLTVNDANTISKYVDAFAEKHSKGDECFSHIAKCLLAFILQLQDKRIDILDEHSKNLVALGLRCIPYQEYLKTDHWKRMRDCRIHDFGGLCAVCCSGQGLEVHHRTYQNLGKEKEQDLTVLCRDCHELFHKAKKLK